MRYLTTSNNCIQLYLSTLPGRCQVDYSTWQRPATTRPTTFHICKTRGCYCSFRLLMMGGVSPETCWASCKYGIINFDTLLHLVGFFCMNCTMMYGSTDIKTTQTRIWISMDICLHWNLSFSKLSNSNLHHRNLHCFHVRCFRPRKEGCSSF